MKVLIVGAGAIGGYIGLRLLEAGQNVCFLVREARLPSLREHGLTLRSVKGDVSVSDPPVVVDAAGVDANVVILACKAWSLDEAAASVAPALADDGLMVPILNGVGHMDKLTRLFGSGRTAGGATYTSAVAEPGGIIRHLNHYDKTVLGGVDATSCRRAAELTEKLRSAGIQAEHTVSMEIDLWEKFTRVTALAALTCLFRAPVGQILKADHGSKIAVGMLDECVRVAGAAGFSPRWQHVKDSRERLTEPRSALAASMMRDMLADSRTEADALVGDMVRRGRVLGIPTPLLDVAWANLQVYEAGRATV